MIEKGDAKELLDPNISGSLDEAQFQKTVLAARCCLTRAATHRPNIREVITDFKCWILCSSHELHQDLTIWSHFYLHFCRYSSC